jgi:hypothetical protein
MEGYGQKMARIWDVEDNGVSFYVDPIVHSPLVILNSIPTNIALPWCR